MNQLRTMNSDIRVVHRAHVILGGCMFVIVCEFACGIMNDEEAYEVMRR